MTDDAELLRRYVRVRSEPAFTEFVQRQINSVYGTALRRSNGDRHLAEEVVQQVFTNAARRAAALSRHPAITAWLHAATRNAVINLRRNEGRRKSREIESVAMSQLQDSDQPSPEWSRLAPVLDSALDELPERDREAVLMKYLDGHTYAEVGGRLQLSEEATRKRVSRALDRLQAALVRKGLTSTSTALGLVLSSQAATVAPSGLALSVAASALGDAAAVGSSIGAGIVTLMSTSKFTAGTLGLALALVGSLAGNAYLMARATQSDAQPVAGQFAPQSTALNPAPRPDLPELLMATTSPAELRDALRASGASETVIRSILEGILLRQYREALSQQRAERHAAGWWREIDRTRATGQTSIVGQLDDPRLLWELVTRPLENLLGPDPNDLAIAETRYAFLPDELREKFVQLELHAPIRPANTGNLLYDLDVKAAYDAEVQAADLAKNDLLDLLTPQQDLAYEMRLGEGVAIARRMLPAELSEQEFVEMFPLASAYARNLDSLLGLSAPVANTKREEFFGELVGQLVDQFGVDRALDLIWASSLEYPILVRVATEGGLSPHTAASIQQLGVETGFAAREIHADPNLTLEEKKAALLNLQNKLRPQVDALLSPELQERLPENALDWLNALGDGQYKIPVTVLPGRSAMSVSLRISLTTSVPAGTAGSGYLATLRDLNSGGTSR